MKNKLAITILVLSLFLPLTNSFASNAWRRIDFSVGAADIRGVFIDQVDHKKLMISTSIGLYNMDLGSPLHVPTRIFNDPAFRVVKTRALIFVTSEKGLFSSKDSGRTWKLEFSEGNVYDLAAVGENFILATDNGVFQRAASEGLWHRVVGPLGRANVHRLLVARSGYWAMTPWDLYFVSSEKGNATVVFSRRAFAEDEDPDKEADDEDFAEGWRQELVDIAFGDQGLYLLARDGLFVSRDNGVAWRPYFGIGSVPGDLSTVVALPGNSETELLCLGSSMGVSCGDEKNFISFYEGLEDTYIRQLAVQNSHGLVAVSRRGIYILDDAFKGKNSEMGANSQENCIFKDYSGILDEFAHEPTVREIQTMAVNYAEANKSKIDAWRRQARIKALLPSVSVGVDRNFNDKYHWDTGPNPDNLTKGRTANNWDASMSWDFSDLIWSTDQTSIDSRSKLMVELREEVIDQVTRIYFERRRLQVELSSCKYVNKGDRMAAEMRVDELTALLDGYTGGVFSQKICQHGSNHQPRRDNV